MQNLGDMMSITYAIIENGIVVNVVVADADIAAQNCWVLLEGSEGIGWKYANGVFTAPPIPEPAPAPPPPTKEELLAQLQALQAQIIALE